MMINGNVLAILMIVAWLGILWIKSEAKSAENRKYENESTERIKEELKSYGFEESELKNLGYYTALDMLSKHKEKVKSQKMQEQAERNRLQEERRKREEEYKKEEKERIKREYEKRPTIFDMVERDYSNVSKKDVDYLDVKLFGNGGEFKFIYIDKLDYEMWNSYINDGELPEDVDVDDLNSEINEAETMTSYFAIYSAEVGTKNHYIQFELEEYTKDDSISFGDLVKDYLFLKGDEDGYIIAQYVESKKHHVEGTIGLDKPLSGHLTKNSINFHYTYFMVGNRKIYYNEFEMGEYSDWWNTEYRAMISVSELKDLKPSDIW